MSSPDLSPAPPAGPPALPLVIQVGFAGTRHWFESADDRQPAAALDARIADEIAGQLRKLPGDLNLNPESFYFCGISQIAIGGDFAFTRACHEAGWMQRIFLPQHRDEFLAAAGSKGPDFTPTQQATARELLALPHIIQERLVSDAADRHDRFQDANLEIARVSDILIALVRAGQEGDTGGTCEFAALAEKRRKPLLKLTVAAAPDGSARVTSEWQGKQHFRPPSLPHALEEQIGEAIPAKQLPDAASYAAWLKDRFSPLAGKQSGGFAKAAFLIIATHIAATLIAVIAIKIHDHKIVPLLLGIELGLLATGFIIHQRLHATHAVRRWADFRLAAEIARSLRAIGGFHAYLEHFFDLPFPPPFRPLLRTLSALHLRSAPRDDARWKAQRDEYVKKRLTDPAVIAQIPYQESCRKKAACQLRRARGVFMVAALSAIVATSTKLFTHHSLTSVASVAGVLAVILPVIAVAALSLAAAFDLEGKKHTSEEMLTFLQEQKALLEAATSSREFRRLLIETESRLLGETVAWHPRRSFLGIA